MTMTETIAQRPVASGPFESESQACEYARSVVGLLAHSPSESANRHVLMTAIAVMSTCRLADSLGVCARRPTTLRAYSQAWDSDSKGPLATGRCAMVSVMVICPPWGWVI